MKREVTSMENKAALADRFPDYSVWEEVEQADISWDTVEALEIPCVVLERGELLEFLKQKGCLS